MKMNDVVPIPPKEVKLEHAGQRILIRFDPNGDLGGKWVWIVDYVRKYPYFGRAASLEAATRAAKRRVEKSNKRQMDTEESSG